jgi:DNA-binding PadR family transcriptional regulator
MSVRQSLLVLLGERPMYGYQLRQEFERRTGATWPLNIGQVYTTLNRLLRDGLVIEAARREDGSVVYEVTEAGRREGERWWLAPVERTTPARDELAIKLALAVTTQGVDVTMIVQRQRVESLRALQEYTRLKTRSDGAVPPGEAGTETPEALSWQLVLDSLIFAAEAEVRWLDHVEQRVALARVVLPPVEEAPVEDTSSPAPLAEWGLS